VATVERWINRIWYGNGSSGGWLLPLSWLFGLLAGARRLAFRVGLIKVQHLPVPVIVVGNITAGGTGKTPLTIWLVRELAARGVRVGVVLRGFGSASARPRTVSSASTPLEVGDEALLIHERARCPVAVGRDRVAAARLLVAQGVQLIIADDGLQHLRLARDLEIAVIDGARGFGNGHLLPAGPLRERPARLARVGAVVINGAGAASWPGALRMSLRGTTLRAVREPAGGTGAGERPLASFAGQKVHALAGIGNPGRFFALLRDAGIEVMAHHFGDHHAFQHQDLRFGDALPVLMTEKDAVKCRSIAGAHCWYLPVAADFSDTDARSLLRRICVDTRLLDFMACPLCKGPLHYDRQSLVLVCRADRLAFPIRDDVPVMLEEEARILAADDPLLQG